MTGNALTALAFLQEAFASGVVTPQLISKPTPTSTARHSCRPP
jgi:hypothetical protein